MAPAVRIDVVGIVLEPKAAQAGEGLRGEHLVELDDVEARGLELQPLGKLADRRDRADPHHPRRDAGRSMADGAIG